MARSDQQTRQTKGEESQSSVIVDCGEQSQFEPRAPFRSTTGKHSLSKCGWPSLAKVGRCLHAFAHALKSCGLWLSAVLLSSSTVSAFPTSEVKNPYLLRQGLFDCLQRRHEEPEVRASSFLVWSLRPCRCMPCLRLACLSPSRSLSVHISVCSSSSTSVLPFTPWSCGGPRLLTCFALLLPLFVISSMWPLACSLKILSSAESLISFWIFNVHKIGMYIRVSEKPRVFKCAYLMCLRSRPISGNNEEHSRFGHAKGASVSTFSSHSQARADRFTKHLPFRKAGTARIRAVTKFGNTVSHIGHTLEIVIVVTTSSFSPCVPLQNTACTSCATTASCDSKKSVHFLPRCVQHLHCFVLCVLSQALRRVLGAFLVA